MASVCSPFVQVQVPFGRHKPGKLRSFEDGEVRFEPMGDQGYACDVGLLTVPMTARFLINDGQHRRAAIEEALRENPDLGDETISVVFFIDAGLERSQQIFADLNKHAVRPTRSIGILYDHRDPFARLALNLVEVVPIFRDFTDWNYTQGHWDNTTLFATYLDDTLGEKHTNRTYRVITPEIVERVFERLEGIKYVPGVWS
ncbi:MAG: DGQHR domain-containing protein [Chloroflexaceae bacterium]|nr:DGQHR domain-containing protein [Chloroflexaceae bacterium]